MGLSRRAYAAHRKARGLPGGSHTAVNKAIETGRIRLDADGTITPATADQQWLIGTDAAQQRTPEAQQQGAARSRETLAADEQRPVTQAQAEAVNEGSGGGGEGSFSGGITFSKARAAREAFAAQLTQLRLKREKGEVVPRAAALAEVFDLARKERDHWMQLPARAAANLAAEFEVDAHAMEVALDRLIRSHLELLTAVRIEILEPPKV